MTIGVHNGWRTSVTSEGPRNVLDLRRSYPNAIPRGRILLGSHVRSGRRAMLISSSKKANLSASRKQRTKLQNNREKKLTFSEFLKHPSFMEAVMNAKALQSYHLVDDNDNTYRCTLPKVQLMSFEVSPVLVLRVTPTQEDVQSSCFPASWRGQSYWRTKVKGFQQLLQDYDEWIQKHIVNTAS